MRYPINSEEIKEKAINYLAQIGCPDEIISQIVNWQPPKLVTGIDMVYWNKWAKGECEAEVKR